MKDNEYEAALRKFDCVVSLVKSAVDVSTRDIIDALETIVSYNGLYRSLVIAKEEIQAADESCGRPDRLCGHGNEQFEILWMLMVVLFGEWGTSPRYGWITDKDAACGFIDALIIDNIENPQHPNHELWCRSHEGGQQ